MYDTINIKNELNQVPKEAKELQETPFNWCGFRWIPYFNNSSQYPIYYYVKMKNLFLKLAGNQLFVKNSLHKYYHDNNYTLFTYQQVVESFEKLNNQLPMNVFTSKITKISMGIVINENPKSVINEWQYYLGKEYLPMKDRNKIYGAKYYLTDYQIKGYDKTFEVKKHNQVKLEKEYFRFEIDNCKPKVLNNKTNNIGIYTVNDLIGKEKFKKVGKMLLDKYIKIEKLPKVDLSTLSLKDKRIYAGITNYEVKESIRRQHPDTYKKDRKEYNKFISRYDNSEFQNQVINKLQQQINYSINN